MTIPLHRLLLLLPIFSVLPVMADVPSTDSIKSVMKQVADWQIEHIGEVYDHKYTKRPHHPAAWTSGALYVGMLKWAAMANDDSYYAWMRAIGEQQQWKLNRNLYFADDHCVGQMYIELYRKYGAPEMIAPTIAQFDRIMAEPSTNSLVWIPKTVPERWSWCDALFMAPPVWAKLSSVTGDAKYRDWMFEEFKTTTDYLYDKEENLYYRDNRFLEKRHNGHKIFWSRGNGWVFGGLTLILPEIPKGSEQHAYFLNRYEKMASKLITIQTKDGYWAMSLLEADTYPTPETSGTAFFCYGLAWGINNGILDRKTYEPAVLKAWDALNRCITPEGMLSYVQPIGASPGEAWPDKTEVYGTGAFLAAGSEVYRLMELTNKPSAKELRIVPETIAN